MLNWRRLDSLWTMDTLLSTLYNNNIVIMVILTLYGYELIIIVIIRI